MTNFRKGKRFETILKRKLINRGFKVLKLAIPETADLVLINKYPILIECKVSQSAVWYRKNNKQLERLRAYAIEGYFVFLAIKFTSNSTIKFFKLFDEYPFGAKKGLSIDDFVNWCNRGEKNER